MRIDTPERFDLRVTAEGTPEYWAEQAAKLLRPVFDLKKPTALLLGRYQPFHDGHKALIVEAIDGVGQVCIAVRDTHGTDEKNPFSFEYVRSRMEHGLRAYEGRFCIILVPNITNIFCGRDVGYKIERIDLDQALQEMSAFITYICSTRFHLSSDSITSCSMSQKLAMCLLIGLLTTTLSKNVRVIPVDDNDLICRWDRGWIKARHYFSAASDESPQERVGQPQCRRVDRPKFEIP